MEEKRVKNHFSSYVRRLYRNTHSSLHVNRLYNTTLYLKYFDMYEIESELAGAGVDDEVFLNFFLKENYHSTATEQELQDFILLQINIRQLDFIMERDLDKDTILSDAKKELAYFEYKTDLKEELPIAHDIYLTTMTMLIKQCEKQVDYKNEKIFSKEGKQRAIDNTFLYTIQMIQNFTLDDKELKLGKGSKEEKVRILQEIIEQNIKMLQEFAFVFKNSIISQGVKKYKYSKQDREKDEMKDKYTTDYNTRDYSTINRHDSYMHFILFEFNIQKYISLSIENHQSNKTKILYDLHLALYEAYSNNIIIKYLHQIADKRTIKKHFANTASDEGIQLHHKYILNLIDIQKNFKHLPLVLLGLDLGLDTESVTGLVEAIDRYKNKNIKKNYLELMQKLEEYQTIEERFVHFKMKNFKDIYSS